MRTVGFVVDEYWGCVVVSDAFTLVVVVVYPVESQVLELVTAFGKLLVLSSEFFAPVTVMRKMVDHFVSSCVSFLLVLRTSQGQGPTILYFLSFENLML